MQRLGRIALVASATLLSVFLLACSLRPQENDLIGTYLATADWGNSVLILKADHTFEQFVVVGSAPSKRIQGQWSTHFASRVDTTILLVPYLTVTHDVHGNDSGGAAASVTKGVLGGIEISADPDWGVSFSKCPK